LARPNSVSYNEELDQIMLSIHNFSEVWIVDHGTTTKESASHSGGRRDKGGDLLYRWGNPFAYRNGTKADQRLFAQHAADWIAPGLAGTGHMLIFNNGNRRPDGAYSTADEVVLPLMKDGPYQRESYLAFGPERAEWSYAAPEKRKMLDLPKMLQIRAGQTGPRADRRVAHEDAAGPAACFAAIATAQTIRGSPAKNSSPAICWRM
jgi:hypothetical protein